MSRHATPSLPWLVLVAFCLAVGVSVPAQAQFASDAQGQSAAASRLDRVAAHPNFGPRTLLAGHLPAWARASNLSAEVVDLNAPMHVSLVLSRDADAQAQFESVLSGQQDPSSSLYHHWLTPSQVGALFGPSAHDLQAVEAWASSEGLRIDSVSPSGTVLELSGTTAAVGNALRVNFATYSAGAERHTAPTSDPSIPAALASVVAGVHGLSQVTLAPQIHAVAMDLPSSKPNNAVRPRLSLSNGEHYITPGDFATIYDLNPLYAAGNTGATLGSAPQHIAIIGRSRIASTDIAAFASTTGISSYHFNTVLASSNDPGTTGTGDQEEATLDVERTIGTAPGAQVDLVISGSSGGYDGVYVAAAYNTNTLLDPVMSISYGACEAQVGAAGVNIWDTLFSTAAAEGISVFVSSGDAGAADCDVPSTTAPALQVTSINYICSSSYVTCVGGTELNDSENSGQYWSSSNTSSYSSALSYMPEGAWNDPTLTDSSGALLYVPSATGGGASQYIRKPVWQTGPGVPADGMRDVPDVSLASAAHDGYYGCLAFTGGDCGQGRFEYFYGTSSSTPGVAAIAALLNTASGAAQGNFNPLLYRAAANPASGAIHDVTVATSGVANCTAALPSVCNNSTPGTGVLSGGLAGYVLTPGYDQVTGVGSVDAARLIAANPAFAVSASSSGVSLSSNGTSSGTLTITLKSLNSFSGMVSLSCTTAGGTIGPQCVVAPGGLTLAANGTATATATFTSIGAREGGGVIGSNRNPFMPVGGGILAAALFCCPPLRRRRRMVTLALLAAVGLGLSGLTGCGSGSAAAGSTTSPTTGAPGTYSFNITATSAASTSSGAHTVTAGVTVTVN